MDSHHITSLVFQFFFIPPSASAAFSFLGMVNLKIKTCNHSSPFDKERQRNLANIDSTQIRLAILIKRDSCRYEICGYANIAAYSNALAIFLNPLLRHLFLFSNHFLRTAFFRVHTMFGLVIYFLNALRVQFDQFRKTIDLRQQ